MDSGGWVSQHSYAEICLDQTSSGLFDRRVALLLRVTRAHILMTLDLLPVAYLPYVLPSTHVWQARSQVYFLLFCVRTDLSFYNGAQYCVSVLLLCIFLLFCVHTDLSFYNGAQYCVSVLYVPAIVTSITFNSFIYIYKGSGTSDQDCWFCGWAAQSHWKNKRSLAVAGLYL